MDVCLHHIEAIVHNQSFFTDLSMYVVKKGDRRKNFSSNGHPYSW